jgi:hypothetical protein
VVELERLASFYFNARDLGRNRRGMKKKGGKNVKKRKIHKETKGGATFELECIFLD